MTGETTRKRKTRAKVRPFDPKNYCKNPDILTLNPETEEIKGVKIESSLGINIAILSEEKDNKIMKQLAEKNAVIIIKDNANRYCEVLSEDREGINKIHNLLSTPTNKDSRAWIVSLINRQNKEGLHCIGIMVKEKTDLGRIKNIIKNHFYTTEEVSKSKKTYNERIRGVLSKA